VRSAVRGRLRELTLFLIAIFIFTNNNMSNIFYTIFYSAETTFYSYTRFQKRKARLARETTAFSRSHFPRNSTMDGVDGDGLA
jgi:hypothetical protein